MTTSRPLEPSDGPLRRTPESLRVLAHPLRARLVGALQLEGPATATRLAVLLGTNSGATSYHLRRLAAAGLVEDTGEGEGKRRLWRATATHTDWLSSEVEGDEDSESALRWLARDYVQHFTQQYDAWLDASTSWPTAWQDACGQSDAMVLVTPEQLTAMREDVLAVLERYRRVGQGNPQAKRIAAYVTTYPLDLDRSPAR